MARVEPGKSEGYLSAATVYWDYYLFNDALRVIRQARTAFDDPALFAFETGAIYENKREYSHAVEQYVAGALDGADQAQQRLLRLPPHPDRPPPPAKFTPQPFPHPP